MEKKKDSQKSKNQKRAYMPQSEFPRLSLEKALKIAEAIWDNFAGKGAQPHQIAMALNYSPTSGPWRVLCGASIAYGLTEGGYNVAQIKLTKLGRRIVAPTKDGDDLVAKVDAVIQPRIMREFYQKYDKAKFPKEYIGENVLISLGVPKDRAKASAKILLENGKYTGILNKTKTGLFLALGTPTPVPPPDEGEEEKEEPESPEKEEIAKKVAAEEPSLPEKKIEKTNRVYISHGKNKEIVNQVKELLKFGQFEPIVSAERESTSVPVPDKVFDDMRECSAAVIHVSSEGKLIDTEGEPHIKINENVLIEIGAAIALYRKNFVLLVEKGVKLPSNLQGLYRCEYEGEKLDADATMKLLKTFNQFR